MPRLAADYLFPGGLTLGGAVAAGTFALSFDHNTTKATLAMLSPRIGYRVELSQSVDFLPRVGVSYLYGSVESPNKTRGAGHVLAATVDPSFAFRLTPSLNLLAGVSFDIALAATGTIDEVSESSGTSSSSGSPQGTLMTLQGWIGLGGYL